MVELHSLKGPKRESRGCCFHFMSEFIKVIIHNLFTSVVILYIVETYMWPISDFIIFKKFSCNCL